MMGILLTGLAMSVAPGVYTIGVSGLEYLRPASRGKPVTKIFRKKSAKTIKKLTARAMELALKSRKSGKPKRTVRKTAVKKVTTTVFCNGRMFWEGKERPPDLIFTPATVAMPAILSEDACKECFDDIMEDIQMDALMDEVSVAGTCTGTCTGTYAGKRFMHWGTDESPFDNDLAKLW
jgi:hypothetical protein